MRNEQALYLIVALPSDYEVVGPTSPARGFRPRVIADAKPVPAQSPSKANAHRAQTDSDGIGGATHGIGSFGPRMPHFNSFLVMRMCRHAPRAPHPPRGSHAVLARLFSFFVELPSKHWRRTSAGEPCRTTLGDLDGVRGARPGGFCRRFRVLTRLSLARRDQPMNPGKNWGRFELVPSFCGAQAESQGFPDPYGEFASHGRTET